MTTRRASKVELSDLAFVATSTVLEASTGGAEATAPSVKQTTNVSVLLGQLVGELSVTLTV